MVGNIVDRLHGRSLTAQDLAKKVASNPNLLPDVVDGISSDHPRIKFGCAKALSLLSSEKPAMIYPRFDRFVELLNSKNNIIKWNMIDVLANLTEVDAKKKFESIFDTYYGLLNDTVMITAAHVIDNSPFIARSKPNLTNKITSALLEVERTQLDSPECRNILIGKAIVAFDRYFEHIEDKDKIIALVRRQVSNSRSATRTKAQRFLGKRKMC